MLHSGHRPYGGYQPSGMEGSGRGERSNRTPNLDPDPFIKRLFSSWHGRSLFYYGMGLAFAPLVLHQPSLNPFDFNPQIAQANLQSDLIYGGITGGAMSLIDGLATLTYKTIKGSRRGY